MPRIFEMFKRLQMQDHEVCSPISPTRLISSPVQTRGAAWFT
jgi:hypothetical protein